MRLDPHSAPTVDLDPIGGCLRRRCEPIADWLHRSVPVESMHSSVVLATRNRPNKLHCVRAPTLAHPDALKDFLRVVAIKAEVPPTSYTA